MFIYSTTKEAEIVAILEQSLTDEGFRLVRLRLQTGRRPVLQIMLERADASPITIEDCSKMARMSSALLDVEDPIAGAYHLEVGSPGTDRPLTRPEDFVRFRGEKAKFSLNTLIENAKRLTGVITNSDQDGCTVAAVGIDHPIEIPFAAIVDAKLVDQ